MDLIVMQRLRRQLAAEARLPKAVLVATVLALAMLTEALLQGWWPLTLVAFITLGAAANTWRHWWALRRLRDRWLPILHEEIAQRRNAQAVCLRPGGELDLNAASLREVNAAVEQWLKAEEGKV